MGLELTIVAPQIWFHANYYRIIFFWSAVSYLTINHKLVLNTYI